MYNDSGHQSHPLSAYAQISPQRTPSSSQHRQAQPHAGTETRLPIAPCSMLAGNSAQAPHSSGFQGHVPPPIATRIGVASFQHREPPTRPYQTEGTHGAQPAGRFHRQRPNLNLHDSSRHSQLPQYEAYQNSRKGRPLQDHFQVSSPQYPSHSARPAQSSSGQYISQYEGQWTHQSSGCQAQGDFVHVENRQYQSIDPYTTQDITAHTLLVQQAQHVSHAQQGHDAPFQRYSYVQTNVTNTPLSQNNPHQSFYNETHKTPQLFPPLNLQPHPAPTVQSPLASPRLQNYFEIDFADIRQRAKSTWYKCCSPDRYERLLKKHQESACSLELIAAYDPRSSDKDKLEKKGAIIVLLIHDKNIPVTPDDTKFVQDTRFEDFTKCPLWFDHLDSFFFDFGNDKHREKISKNSGFIHEYFSNFGQYTTSIENQLLKVSGTPDFVRGVSISQNIGVDNRRRVLVDFVAEYSLWAKTNELPSDDEDDSVILAHPGGIPPRKPKSPQQQAGKVVKPSTKVQLRNSLSIPKSKKPVVNVKAIQPVHQVDLTSDGADVSHYVKDDDIANQEDMYDTAELANHIQKELDSPVVTTRSTFTRYTFGSGDTGNPLMVPTGGMVPPEMEKEDDEDDDMDSLFGKDEQDISAKSNDQRTHITSFAASKKSLTRHVSSHGPLHKADDVEIPRGGPNDHKAVNIEPVVISDYEEEDASDIEDLEDVKDVEDANDDGYEDDDDDDDDGTQLLKREILSPGHGESNEHEEAETIITDTEVEDVEEIEDGDSGVEDVEENNTGFSDQLARGIIRETFEGIPSKEAFNNLKTRFLFLDYENGEVDCNDLTFDIKDRLRENGVHILSIYYKERSVTRKRFCLHLMTPVDVFNAVKCLHGFKYRSSEITASLCEDIIAEDFIKMNKLAYEHDSAVSM